MTPEEVLTSLQRLSAPGYNRAVGSGDVSPYRSSTDPTAIGGNAQTASDAVAATPGASGMWGAPSTPQPFDPNSFLNNLSAFMPMISQLLQAQQPAVRSGVGDATATPTATAVGGPSSADLGGLNIAGAQAPSPAPSLDPHAGMNFINGMWVPGAPLPGGGLNLGSGEGSSAGTGPGGEVGGPVGDGPAGESGDGGGGTAGGGGGVGGSAGAFKRGGMVMQGNPKSKTDDVQHGEYVIPREDVRALAHHAVDNSTMPRATHEQVDHFFGVPAALDERSEQAGTSPGPAFKYSRGGYIQGGTTGASAPALSGLGAHIAQRISTLDPTRRMAANEALNQNILGRIAAAKAGQARAALPGLAAHVVQLARQHGVPVNGPQPAAPSQSAPSMGIPRQVAGVGTPAMASQPRPAIGFAQGGLVDADAGADPYQALLASIAQRQNNPFGGWTDRTLADASAHGVMRNVPADTLVPVGAPKKDVSGSYQPVMQRNDLAKMLFDMSKPTPGQ